MRLTVLFVAALLIPACGGGNAASAPVSAPEPAPPPMTAVMPAPVADIAPPPPSGGSGVTGVNGLTAEQVQAVVTAHHGALLACYDTEAKRDPTLRGDVTVAWTVDEMGMVIGVGLTDSTIRNDSVEGCVLRQVRAWRFPPSAGDTQTTLPFSFGSRESRGCSTSVNGRLPPEAIKHVIKLNSGRFRQCYENGLLHNPKLSGRVAVKFVIDRSGAVASQVDAGSDLPDAAVIACVVQAFGGLSFPQPEGGLVSVVYPFVFNPKD